MYTFLAIISSLVATAFIVIGDLGDNLDAAGLAHVLYLPGFLFMALAFFLWIQAISK